MKRALLVAILYSITLVALAQTVIEKAWTTSATAEGLQQIDTRITELVTKLDQHHYRNDVQKLHALFTKTHSTFLHSYVQYTGIEELAKGRYDCLTATSLFADILGRTGFKFNIIETNYHIFIMVDAKDGDVLLETTDRIAGFIDNPEKIEKVIGQYRQNILAGANAEQYQYNFSLFKKVDVDQLPGLLYFNQAVKAFNSEKWDECSQKLSAAAMSTNSPHVAALTELLHRQPYFSGR
ncbi:MAG TPA: hypothetical protein VF473_03680 [Cyclobacteriaceae bacterium]